MDTLAYQNPQVFFGPDQIVLPGNFRWYSWNFQAQPPSPLGGESFYNDWQRAADGDFWSAHPHLSPIRIAPFPTRSLFEYHQYHTGPHPAWDSRPFDFIERDLFHRHIEPLTDVDAERNAHLTQQEAANNYLQDLWFHIESRQLHWDTFVAAVAHHNIRQIHQWRDRALAEPIPAFQVRQDIFSRATWSPYGDPEVFRQEIERLHIFGQHRYTPGHFQDADESVQYQRFIASLNGNRDILDASTQPYDSERSEDDFISERDSDSVERNAGKDPASPFDEGQLDSSGGGQDEDIFGCSSKHIRQ